MEEQTHPLQLRPLEARGSLGDSAPFPKKGGLLLRGAGQGPETCQPALKRAATQADLDPAQYLGSQLPRQKSPQSWLLHIPQRFDRNQLGKNAGKVVKAAVNRWRWVRSLMVAFLAVILLAQPGYGRAKVNTGMNT